MNEQVCHLTLAQLTLFFNMFEMALRLIELQNYKLSSDKYYLHAKIIFK